jgi:hypothetical protein
MFEITYKYINWWGRKGVGTLEKVEFIRVVKKDKGVEDYHIELLSNGRMAQINSTTKHWPKFWMNPKP